MPDNVPIANSGLFTRRDLAAGTEAFRTVKLFDLAYAPDFIQQAIRPIAAVHASNADGCAIWEITVGTYDWQNAAEEWALHRWLRENGAAEKEAVLLRFEAWHCERAGALRP